VAFSPIANGSRGRGRFQHGGVLSEINVTPFVDVLLVLLIIFMLTAHVMESGIEVDVPTVKTTKDTTKDLAIVNINKEGELYLGDKIININDLAPTILKRYGKTPTVYVRADKAVTWEIVAQVYAELGAAKIGVNAVTKPEDTSRRRH
jgi:biopolymer transport protein ExbD